MLKTPATRHDKTREKILDTAAKLFAEQGYAATSVEQVIAQCKIGKDTFYRRFNAKLALFESVAQREREIVNRQFSEFVSTNEGTRLEQLKHVMRWLLDVNLEPRLIMYKRIAFSEATVVGRASQEAENPVTDYLLELVKSLQSSHVLQQGEPAELVTYLINTVVLAPMTMAMLGDETPNTQQWRDAYFQRTWSRMLHGVQVDD